MNKVKLRKSKVDRGETNLLGSLVLDQASIDSCADQLRLALYKRQARERLREIAKR